jgi:hypothetical protein
MQNSKVVDSQGFTLDAEDEGCTASTVCTRYTEPAHTRAALMICCAIALDLAAGAATRSRGPQPKPNPAHRSNRCMPCIGKYVRPHERVACRRVGRATSRAVSVHRAPHRGWRGSSAPPTPSGPSISSSGSGGNNFPVQEVILAGAKSLHQKALRADVAGRSYRAAERSGHFWPGTKKVRGLFLL